MEAINMLTHVTVLLHAELSDQKFHLVSKTTQLCIFYDLDFLNNRQEEKLRGNNSVVDIYNRMTL